MEILPIGSVVKLKNGEVKLMIINRAPLYNRDGVIGYFDYSACIYPNGKVEEQVYFFNDENIEKVYFKGYIDEQEELFQQEYEEKIKNVNYPKFKIDDE
ncbi:DUF4176 domain-containing protein [Virgibacillus kimchii]